MFSDSVVTAKGGILNFGELMAKDKNLPLGQRADWRRLGRSARILEAAKWRLWNKALCTLVQKMKNGLPHNADNTTQTSPDPAEPPWQPPDQRSNQKGPVTPQIRERPLKQSTATPEEKPRF